MWMTTAAFKNCVTNGGTWVVKGDVSQKGVLVRQDVPIIDGNFAIDKFAAVRRRTSLTISADDATWIPKLGTDPLFPGGNELLLQAGFEYEDGTQELVPCGKYRISRPGVHDDGASLLITLDGYDRSRAVSRAKFLRPYVVAAGTPFPQAIRDIIGVAFPWISQDEYQFLDTEDDPCERMIFDSGDDPWNRCTAIAAGRGCEVFFGPDGAPVLQEEPDPSYADPVWQFVEGETATILDLNKDLDDEQAFNGWIIIGRNTASGAVPVRASSWDTDPQSPTYFDPVHPADSVYGRVPTMIQSDNIVTVAQAQKAANAQLRRGLGILEQMDFAAMPNPAHEGGDVVTIKRERARVDEVNVVDVVNCPLGLGGAMTVSTRKRRILA